MKLLNRIKYYFRRITRGCPRGLMADEIIPTLYGYRSARFTLCEYVPLPISRGWELESLYPLFSTVREEIGNNIHLDDPYETLN